MVASTLIGRLLFFKASLLASSARASRATTTLAEAEHVCESKLATSITVRYLRLGLRNVADHVVVECFLVGRVAAILLQKVVEGCLGQQEIALVWVILDWPTEHYIA